jgi:hypothetical protein
MINTAAILLAIAAVGGLVMVVKIFGGSPAPLGLSLLHAALGAAGLVMVAIPVLKGEGTTMLTVALLVLAIAAVGGFYVASFRLKNQLPPKPVVVVHALVAVSGFLTLLSTLL